MLIISDFLSNLRNMFINGSIIAMFNVLVYIVLISLIIYYINYYKCINNIVIESPSVTPLLEHRVRYLQVLKSTIIHKFDKMPCTHNFSHWSIRAYLYDTNKRVIISSSRINNIHLYDDTDEKNPNYTIECKKLKVINKMTTLADIANYAHEVINDSIYGYNLYNCQNVVYSIIDNYCSTADASNYIPFKDKKLVYMLKKELMDRQ